jgi:hypothetical protein
MNINSLKQVPLEQIPEYEFMLNAVLSEEVRKHTKKSFYGITVFDQVTCYYDCGSNSNLSRLTVEGVRCDMGINPVVTIAFSESPYLESKGWQEFKSILDNL